jgi:hypothetical protein
MLSLPVTLVQLDHCIGPDCRRERERRYMIGTTIGDIVTIMIGDIDAETTVAT